MRKYENSIPILQINNMKINVYVLISWRWWKLRELRYCRLFSSLFLKLWNVRFSGTMTFPFQEKFIYLSHIALKSIEWSDFLFCLNDDVESLEKLSTRSFIIDLPTFDRFLLLELFLNLNWFRNTFDRVDRSSWISLTELVSSIIDDHFRFVLFDAFSFVVILR